MDEETQLRRAVSMMATSLVGAGATPDGTRKRILSEMKRCLAGLVWADEITPGDCGVVSIVGVFMVVRVEHSVPAGCPWAEERWVKWAGQELGKTLGV